MAAAAAAALGLVLGLCLPGPGGAVDAGPPPRPPPLPCVLLGPGGAPTPRPALLLLGGAPEPDPPRGTEPDVTFHVTDPWDTLAGAWGPPWTPPKCELSPTVPVVTPPPWAPSLTHGARSPPALGGSWWVATLETPHYGVTALLRGPPGPPGPPGTPLTAALSVFTRTPELGGSPGSPLSLHCAFAAPPGPFALQWRHQRRGGGRLLLAFDSAARRVPAAAPGHRLLLGGDAGGGVRQVTLRLDALDVAHEGAYVCAIFLPHGQAQALLRLRVLAPPRVTLRPTPLVVAPGAAAELRCDASGYFPLDVGVRWQRRGAAGTPLPLGDTVTHTWSSGHRRRPDGTFGRSSGARLGPARPGHHGDVYVCLVTHPALAAPRRARVRLEVAGAEGPGLEDAVGLSLVAFVLCGLWRWLGVPPPRPEQDPKKRS